MDWRSYPAVRGNPGNEQANFFTDEENAWIKGTGPYPENPSAYFRQYLLNKYEPNPPPSSQPSNPQGMQGGGSDYMTMMNTPLGQGRGDTGIAGQ